MTIKDSEETLGLLFFAVETFLIMKGVKFMKFKVRVKGTDTIVKIRELDESEKILTTITLGDVYDMLGVSTYCMGDRNVTLGRVWIPSYSIDNGPFVSSNKYYIQKMNNALNKYLKKESE